MAQLRIVIPTRNEEKYLPDLLQSIRGQTFRDFEIAVADADSTDNTRRIAEDFGCRVTRGGYPDVGRNSGAAGCTTPLVCFVDSDVVLPDRRFLEESLNEFHRRRLDMAGTIEKPIPTGHRCKDVFYRTLYRFVDRSIVHSQDSKSPLMQNVMLMKTAIHRKLGGFPPYEFGEDAALAKKAVSEGYRFGILREAGKAWVSMRRYENGGAIRTAAKYAYFNFARMLGHEFVRGQTRTHYWGKPEDELAPAPERPIEVEAA